MKEAYLESQLVSLVFESHFCKTNLYFSWCRIKHDFLHRFWMPRCDLLVWILVTKLAPSYYLKMDHLLAETSRYRELCSWKRNLKSQNLKSEWRKLEKREITLPINDAAYEPNTAKWTWTCPAFVTSRFLICKHLNQDCPISSTSILS